MLGSLVKGAWKVTGGDVATRNVTAIGKETSRSWSSIKLAVGMLRRTKDNYEAPEGADGKARFEAAVANYGYTQESLARSLRNAHDSFWLYWGLAVIVSMLSAYASSKWGVLITVYTVYLGLRSGCLNWSIRRRSFDGFFAYLRSGDWTPVRTTEKA